MKLSDKMSATTMTVDEDTIFEWMNEVRALESRQVAGENLILDIADLEADVRVLKAVVEPLNRFPREQWDWMLEYLPDDDNPQYDALRESLDALATIKRTSALEASGFRDELAAPLAHDSRRE